MGVNKVIKRLFHFKSDTKNRVFSFVKQQFAIKKTN
jgi:hypothetical protein